MNISILFITYNRAHLLQQSIKELRIVLDKTIIEYEIVIADDCSNEINRQLIDLIPNVRVARTSKNSGLGANCNNGIDFCKNEIILQIQDDWSVIGLPEYFVNCINMFSEFDNLGILQLNKVNCDIGSSYFETNQHKISIFKNDHLPWIRGCDLRPYSDQPHLKRKKFHNDLGGYLENCPMTVCELDFKMRVANQKKWRIGMTHYAPMFIHIGKDESLNPGGISNRYVRFVRSIPVLGNFIVRIIKNAIYVLEHVAALIASIIFDRK